MQSAAVLNFHRAQYKQQGFTIFLNAARPAFLERMSNIVAQTHERNLIEGDESSHSWKEIAIDPPLALLEIFADFNLAGVIDGEPLRMTQWLNIYRQGEFIGTHVDAGGEAQLMIPIEMPPSGEGGDLWVENKRRILPVTPGDVLLFAAHRLRHGTTTVKSGRRISFNGRMWLS